MNENVKTKKPSENPDSPSPPTEMSSEEFAMFAYTTIHRIEQELSQLRQQAAQQLVKGRKEVSPQIMMAPKKTEHAAQLLREDNALTPDQRALLTTIVNLAGESGDTPMTLGKIGQKMGWSWQEVSTIIPNVIG